MRMLAPLSAHELHERLRQDNGVWSGNRWRLPGQPGPQSLESAFMARQAADVCVRDAPR